MGDNEVFSVADLAAQGMVDAPTDTADGPAITAGDFPLLHSWLALDEEEFKSQVDALVSLPQEHAELNDVDASIKGAGDILVQLYLVRDQII